MPLGAGNLFNKEAVFVDVGGTGDCGFRSVAAGLIDNFITHPSVFPVELLKQVLEAHFNYFPKHRTDLPGLVKPSDRMNQLIINLSMGELVQSMAYTLRQLAVGELCRHPELYRGAFVNGHEQTSPDEMRKPSTWIDESSIAALANVLNMPIEVIVAHREDALSMRLHYNPQAENLSVAVKLQGCHYIPRVIASERFNRAKSQTVHLLPVVRESTVNDPTLPEILERIAKDDRNLVRVFEDTSKNLALKVKMGDLSQDDLLTMYVNAMGDSDYLAGRVNYVGIEHGNQDFFNAVFQSQAGFKSSLQLTGTTDSLTDELVHALARAVSIGQMNPEQLFAPIDSDADQQASLR
jgi:hypothetical protein